MRKTFCDKCGKGITEDVTMVFNHELCPECAKAVDTFITRTTTYIMDEVRELCVNFNNDCKECPFYNKDAGSLLYCSLKAIPYWWPPEEEIYSKLLDYKVNHPDWRKTVAELLGGMVEDLEEKLYDNKWYRLPDNKVVLVDNCYYLIAHPDFDIPLRAKYHDLSNGDGYFNFPKISEVINTYYENRSINVNDCKYFMPMPEMPEDYKEEK